MAETSKKISTSCSACGYRYVKKFIYNNKKFVRAEILEGDQEFRKIDFPLYDLEDSLVSCPKCGVVFVFKKVEKIEKIQ